jgi:hypothetical protein
VCRDEIPAEPNAEQNSNYLQDAIFFEGGQSLQQKLVVNPPLAELRALWASIADRRNLFGPFQVA